jgi:hypothetical protein
LVNAILRPLLVLILLLALPFQGIAASGMLACAPVTTPPAMTAACHEHAAALADGGRHEDARQDRHGKGSCSSCCVGAAMAPAVLLQLSLARPEFIAIPFRAGHVPRVDPAVPERPPRSFFA